MSEIKVATYSRVSTIQHEQNPEIQVQELRRYCTARGWKISHEFVDHGYTGGSARRPGLQQLLQLVHSREVEVVVVVKLDRLFRSLKHLVTTLDDLQALGVKFVAIRDNVDYTTPSGRLFVQVLGGLAEFERSLIRERTMMGLAHAVALGKTLGRPALHDFAKIRSLRSKGLSFRAIQKKMGCPISSIYRALEAVPKSEKTSDGQEPVSKGSVIPNRALPNSADLEAADLNDGNGVDDVIGGKNRSS